MAKNLKFYINDQGAPCARGPHSEKLLVNFLESDVQGDEHLCQDLMLDLRAVESSPSISREFIGNSHNVTMTSEEITIECHVQDENKTSDSGPEAKPDAKPEANSEANPVTTPVSTPAEVYKTGLKQFRGIVEDWEAFILEEQDSL